jgi:hypothetical protein
MSTTGGDAVIVIPVVLEQVTASTIEKVPVAFHPKPLVEKEPVTEITPPVTLATRLSINIPGAAGKAMRLFSVHGSSNTLPGPVDWPREAAITGQIRLRIMKSLPKITVPA